MECQNNDKFHHVCDKPYALLRVAVELGKQENGMEQNTVGDIYFTEWTMPRMAENGCAGGNVQAKLSNAGTLGVGPLQRPKILRDRDCIGHLAGMTSTRCHFPPHPSFLSRHNQHTT